MEDSYMAYDQNIKRLPDPYYKNGLGFASATIKAVSTGTSHPLNGGGVVSTIFKGGYWEIDVSYPDTLTHELDTILPFLDSLEGSFNPFYILLPQYKQPKTGAWDLSNAVKSCAGAIQVRGPKVISVPAWSTRGGSFSPGDMLKFSNSAKIYKVTDIDIVGDKATIELNTPVKFPSKVTVASFEPNDIMFRVVLKDNSAPAPRLQPNGIYSAFSISMRENVRDE